MKKFIPLLVVCFIFPLLAGCSSLYNPYPKNTVMIKNLEAKEQFKVQDDALLSEETIKSLGINAINKYFNNHLSKDNVEFELQSIDYSDIKKLLASATSYLNLDQDILDSYIEQLNKVSSGLYFITITNVFNEYDIYGITINPSNGEILRATKAKNFAEVKVSEEDARVDDEKLVQLAKQFADEKELINTAIDASQIRVYQTMNGLSELYYISDDRKVMFYFMINYVKNEVVDFSKDVLAAIQIAHFDSRYFDYKMKYG